MKSYPSAPGHRGVDTSIAAAQALAPNLAGQRQSVFHVIELARGYGGTGDEVARKLNWNRYAVRPRLSELKNLGKIIDSGKRRRNSSGRYAIVWVLPCYAASDSNDC